MSDRAVGGTVIEGKYRLERELGAGGMGAVWLATQLMVDRNVAVKLLHPAFIDSDDLQARFEVEAKAIGRLSHPNCITLYDFGFSEDLRAFYTVIEYIDGVSLDKRLGEDLPLEEIIVIIRQVALALDHAHHQGILHRDLKPENVMLAGMTDGSEIVKVLDFGIARIVKGDATQESVRITKAGEVFGTPAYMSPEQARSTRQLTPASDLYALGVMFYELVSGRLPYFSKSAFDLLMMHVTKPVPPIEHPGVPQSVKNIIYRLLDKEPENRPQSGKELADLLKNLNFDAPPARPYQPTYQFGPEAGDEVIPPNFEEAHKPSDMSISETTNFSKFDRNLQTERQSDTERSNAKPWVLALAFISFVAVLGVILVSLSQDSVEAADPEEPLAENPIVAEPEAVTATREPTVIEEHPQLDPPEEPLVFEDPEEAEVPEKAVAKKPKRRPKKRPKTPPVEKPAKKEPTRTPTLPSINLDDNASDTQKPNLKSLDL